MVKKMKKVLAAVLALAIMLLPLSAFAEGASNAQIVKNGGERYYDANGNEVSASELGANGAVVGLSKTIEGTGLENEFDITLTVESTLKQEENWKITTVPDAAVVLTIDMSGTMERNKMDGKTYVAVAKAKALDFIEKYQQTAVNTQTGEMSNAKRMIAVVVFDTDARVQMNWVDVNWENHGGKAAFEANVWPAVEKAITGIKVADNGDASSNQVCTNFDGGVILSKNLFKQSAVSSIGKEHSWDIILSDGAPTVTVSGDSSAAATIKSTFWTGQGYQNARAGGGWTHPMEVVNAKTYMTALAEEAQICIVGVGGLMDTKLFYDAVYGTANGSRGDIARKKDAFDNVEPLKSLGLSGDGIMALTTGDWMTYLAQSVGGTYVSAIDTAMLNTAFAGILSGIVAKTETKTEMSTAWNAVDPINAGSTTPYVEFLGFYSDAAGYTADDTEIALNPDGDTAAYAGGEIKWDLKQSKASVNGNVYSYSIKYRVRLKNERDGFVEGKDYITNGVTTFTYQTVADNSFGEEHTGYFPVPEVEGYLGELVFNKVDEKGNALSGAEFVLEHKEDCACHDVEIADMTAVSGDGGKVEFASIPSGHSYTLSETKAPEGYVKDEASYSVTVSYGTTVAAGGLKEVVNMSLGKLTVAKDVTGARSEADFEEGAFEILVSGPEGYTKEVKLPVKNANGGLDWSVTLDNLAAGEYTVVETAAAEAGNGYSVKASYNVNGSASEIGNVNVRNTETAAVTVVNDYTYMPNSTDVTVTKVWDDGNNQDGIRPDAVKFALYVGGEKADEKAVDVPVDGNTFTATFTYDAYKLEGEARAEEIGYYVGNEYFEGMPAGYTAEASEDGLTITNTHVPEVISIDVTKVWGEGTEGKEQTVKVNLLANGEIVDSKEIAAPAEGEAWKVSFDNLPKFAGGSEIAYSVEEEALGENWYQSITHEGYAWTVENTYKEEAPEVTAHTVVKVWNDSNNAGGLRPAAIYVQLMQDGVQYGSAVELNAENGWSFTFEELPVGHIYSAAETFVPVGYEASVRISGGLTTITNTAEGEEEEEEPAPPRRNQIKVPGVVIEDEPVPLADAPETGDNTVLIIACVIAAAIIALAIVFIVDRKKKKNAK